jgi:hypothetical protein
MVYLQQVIISYSQSLWFGNGSDGGTAITLNIQVQDIQVVLIVVLLKIHITNMLI